MTSLTSEDIAVQREWSFRTFGPGERLAGVLQHLYKELHEIGGSDMMHEIAMRGPGGWVHDASPGAADEWADLIILAIDGAMRQGIEPDVLIEAYHAKMSVNMSEREWPDWRDFGQDEAIEHVREE